MMKQFPLPRSLSTRLFLSFLALILLTTLSAGIPAYLLTRAQLERQAWSQVDGAQRATRSLLRAEEERLANLAILFAERPTLQRIAQAQNEDDLRRYLTAFRQQSNLDVLIFCDTEGKLIAGNGTPEECSGRPTTGFVLFGDRPALIVNAAVDDEATGQLLGSTLAGVWLDNLFLTQLSANTGIEQSVLIRDGRLLATSLPGDAAREMSDEQLTAEHSTEIALDNSPYYATYLALEDGEGETNFLLEVALPVADLKTTEIRALVILAGSTGLVAILASLLGIWYVRQLVAPLQQLTEVAERIGTGNLMAAIPLISRPAEVSTLATALHHSQASMLRALDERSQARDWLNALIQSIVEGVVTVDSDGRVTFLSQGAERLSGWTPEEALGKPLDDVFPVTDEEGGAFLDRVPPIGKKRQISVHTRAGKNVVLAVTSAQMTPPGLETTQLALVLRDVTEEEALRHLRAYFLANISHEFLTPLSTLNASMELMLDPDEALSTEEMRQLLKPSHVSLRALQTLVNNLLESSSIEAGQFTLYRQPTDPNQVLEDALRIVSPLLKRRHQQLVVGETGLLQTIEADPARLTQVLVNLLVNASKYSPPGKPIDVELSQQRKTLRVSVADRGPGIPPAERANIFRRFVRRETGDGRQYGVGLGLFVVKATITAHGGRVGVDDRPGGGSIFWFELPLSDVEDDQNEGIPINRDAT